MSVEETIRRLLLQNDEVAELLGERIYPVASPHQPVLPFAVYQLISSPEGQQLDGPDLANNRLQFSFVDDDWQVTRNVMETVRKAMLAIPRGTYFGVVIDSVTVLDKRDMGLDVDTALYRHDIDFDVVQQLS